MKSHRESEQPGVRPVRTFICIEIPESIKDRIDRLQNSLRKIDSQISWTKASNIHLTLKFLGGVEPTRISRVVNAVERAATKTPPFEIDVGGAGCFPSPRHPRVLWIGVPVVPEPLIQLYSDIENELGLESFAREPRKFAPHLTIARVRSPKNASLVAEALIAAGFTPETFLATEVLVMRSDLKPTGSVYTAQAVSRLVPH